MRQFAYRILSASDVSEGLLNDLGKHGWELVCSGQSIVHGSYLVLKRELAPSVEDGEGRVGGWR